MWFRFEGKPPLIRDEQAESFIRNQRLSLTITSLLAISILTLLGTHDDQPGLVVWFVAICALNLLRFTFAAMSIAGGSLRFQSDLILRVSLWGSALAGLAWACVPLFYVDYTTAQAPFALIVLCGLTAGASLQSRAYAGPALVLCSPVLTSIIVKLFLLGTESGFILGFDVLLFMAMMVRSSFDSETAFAASASIRHEARALAARLQVEQPRRPPPPNVSSTSPITMR